MDELAAVQVIVYGHVQGVFFRSLTQRQARRLKLTGYVRNLPAEEAVEIRAEGEVSGLRVLLRCLHTGPPTASVDRIVTKWSEYTGAYSSFNIIYLA